MLHDLTHSLTLTHKKNAQTHSHRYAKNSTLKRAHTNTHRQN